MEVKEIQFANIYLVDLRLSELKFILILSILEHPSNKWSIDST
jgi:hypothetical protein